MTSTAAPRTQFTTPGDTDIVAVRTFAAPRENVWSAYTEPRHLQQWLSTPDGPLEVCEVDLRVGGAYRYRWGIPTGESFGFSGEFLEIEAPSRLVCTEVYEPAPSMAEGVLDGPPAVNTLTLEEADGRTTLTLLMRYASRGVREAVLASGMTGGFDVTLDQLEELLADD